MVPYLKSEFVSPGLNILVSITSPLCLLGPNIRPAVISLHEAITKVLRNSEGKVTQNTLLKTQTQLYVPVYIPI